MKKIILAATIILVTGISTVVVSQEKNDLNNAKAPKIAKVVSISTSKNILATAD